MLHQTSILEVNSACGSMTRLYFWNFLLIDILTNLWVYFWQYYYAHANKNFSTEGAQHFREDGKIYGGDPVLIKSYSQDERPQAQAAAPQVETKKITKFSWGDEDAKVKVYIESNQFTGEITKEMVDVKFEEYLCDIKITDQEGTCHVLNLYKLSEKIEPTNCSFRVSAKRITITLKKWLETSWTDLTRAANSKKWCQHWLEDQIEFIRHRLDSYKANCADW